MLCEFILFIYNESYFLGYKHLGVDLKKHTLNFGVFTPLQ